MSGPPPSAEALAALARAAFARIPQPFAAHLDGIAIHVADFADDETLADLGIEDAWELSGLYHGRSLRDGADWAPGELPPAITLFRLPLLLEWIETDVALAALVTHVVIHEVGHHFGLSDAEMDALEQEAG